jgi:hypothetical protein
MIVRRVRCASTAFTGLSHVRGIDEDLRGQAPL